MLLPNEIKNMKIRETNRVCNLRNGLGETKFPKCVRGSQKAIIYNYYLMHLWVGDTCGQLYVATLTTFSAAFSPDRTIMLFLLSERDRLCQWSDLNLFLCAVLWFVRFYDLLLSLSWFDYVNGELISNENWQMFSFSSKYQQPDRRKWLSLRELLIVQIYRAIPKTFIIFVNSCFCGRQRQNNTQKYLWPLDPIGL